MNLRARLKLIRDLYCADSRPWVLAFSGGKDSTAVLQLVWLALVNVPPESRSKFVDICYVDTGMDHPLYRAQISETLTRIELSASEHGMPFRFHVLAPELKHRFFVAVVGRGYAPPTHWFRWCTSGMRIRPMSRFIRSSLDINGEIVIALGLRRAESGSRQRVLDKYASGMPFISTYGNMKRATALTPIEDLGKEEVWQILMQVPVPWGARNQGLVQLYSMAAGGECASYSTTGGMAPSCGGSRFGCWTCTVVRQDKSGAALTELDERFQALTDFREWLIVIRYDAKRRWTRRRNGAPGPGPLRLATRKEALRKLLSAQSECGYPLVTEEEVLAIQEHWTRDGDRKNTALDLYRNHIFSHL